MNFFKNPKNLIILESIIILFLICVVIYLFFNKNTTEKYSGVPRIINFNTEWCGYSKQFKPVWDEFSKLMRGRNIQVIDKKCDVDKDFCKKNEIMGYPTVILFLENEKIPYNGPRKVESLINFVNKYI